MVNAKCHSEGVLQYTIAFHMWFNIAAARGNAKAAKKINGKLAGV
jgi:hypothetical protein